MKRLENVLENLINKMKNKELIETWIDDDIDNIRELSLNEIFSRGSTLSIRYLSDYTNKEKKDLMYRNGLKNFIKKSRLLFYTPFIYNKSILSFEQINKIFNELNITSSMDDTVWLIHKLDGKDIRYKDSELTFNIIDNDRVRIVRWGYDY